MLEELVFPWCPDCPLYFICYADDHIYFLEEDCRFGVASNCYAQEVLKDTNKSYLQIFIY